MIDLAQEIGVPESEWRPLYREGFAGSRPYPSQCVHIALPHAFILVDAGDYAQAIALEPSYLPPVYVSPPGLVEQLQSQGTRLEDIMHVIITHAPFDHDDGTTVERDGEYVPLFPNVCLLTHLIIQFFNNPPCVGYVTRPFQRQGEKTASAILQTTYYSRQTYASFLNSRQFYGGRDRKISIFSFPTLCSKEKPYGKVMSAEAAQK